MGHQVRDQGSRFALGLSMTKEEYYEAINAICPHCHNKAKSRYRPETNEWVHDMTVVGPRGGFQHAICWASGFRTSRFNEGFEDGKPANSG